jgi:hypothetical protein
MAKAAKMNVVIAILFLISYFYFFDFYMIALFFALRRIEPLNRQISELLNGRISKPSNLSAGT